MKGLLTLHLLPSYVRISRLKSAHSLKDHFFDWEFDAFPKNTQRDCTSLLFHSMLSRSWIWSPPPSENGVLQSRRRSFCLSCDIPTLWRTGSLGRERTASSTLWWVSVKVVTCTIASSSKKENSYLRDRWWSGLSRSPWHWRYVGTQIMSNEDHGGCLKSSARSALFYSTCMEGTFFTGTLKHRTSSWQSSTSSKSETLALPEYWRTRTIWPAHL